MPRHIPQRTCIGCRAVRPKRELLRVVRTPEGEVAFDPTGRRAGRGAYLCPDPACLDRALRARELGRALKTDLDAATVEALRRQLAELVTGADAGAGR
ncbi:YlxR family protein [Thermaerobacter sp. PB12/4term]|uniref:RNase P modulator RnpM n=1 Tax=Thermaerobacter sp. PB12/4term TaxID=2293838 RepID=UPI000E32C686|nr:YlxR family protein [Thermaerobacter sp. PB12/4term]QIA26968.1 YlxR family protein [Thermaerobacter sp. PB12/4term]